MRVRLRERAFTRSPVVSFSVGFEFGVSFFFLVLLGLEFFLCEGKSMHVVGKFLKSFYAKDRLSGGFGEGRRRVGWKKG